jgi:hypothetical protein
VVEEVKQEVVAEEKVEEKEPEVEKEPVKRKVQPISESNIEYIKTKINRTKKRSTREGSWIYRFLIFLLALIGF